MPANAMTMFRDAVRVRPTVRAMMRVGICLLHVPLVGTTARAGEYLFEAYLCEVAEESLTERVWTIPTNLIAAVTTFVDLETARTFMESHADDVVPFPVLRLRAGERASADEQEMLRYGVEFDEEGRVTRYDETGIGLRIEAELLDEWPNRLEIEFLIEQTWLENWLPYTTDTGEAYRLPAFGSRRWNASPTFTLDQWLWIGGLARKTDGVPLHQIALIRVRPARKPH